MKQVWYGPLVELRALSSHLGCHVQLVVFVEQSHPPERVRTMKGKQVTRIIHYVCDSSSPVVKISQWNSTATSYDIAAGDIILLQNMKVVKFRGQIELTNAPSSEIVPLLERRDFFTSQGVENALARCQQGPLVKEKFMSLTCWAKCAQHNLLTFLNQISDFSNAGIWENRGGQREALTSEMQVRKCSSILEASSIQEHCVVEFHGTVGEIFLPSIITRGTDSVLSLKGCLLFSKNLHKWEQAEELLRELLCIGCEMCGRELNKDRNGVFEGCHCGPLSPPEVSNHPRAKQKQASRIFRPFFLHVGDQSGQTTVIVRHAAAVRIFGEISTESVFQSLQGRNLPHRGGQEGADRMLLGDTQILAMDKILAILLKCLLSRDNRPFQFRVICNPLLRVSLEHLSLVSMSVPPMT